jgi:hypothetical protein
MHNPLPKITAAGRAGVCLLTFAADKLDPQLMSRALLHGLCVLGVMLIVWEAVTHAARLAQHSRSKSYQGPSTFPRPSQQPFDARKDGAR